MNPPATGLLLAAALLAGCAQPEASGTAAASNAAQAPLPARTAAGTADASPRPIPAAPDDSPAEPGMRLPGLPSASGPQLDTARLQRLPAEVAAVLATLFTREALVPADIRQRILAQHAYVIDLPQPDGRHDYLAADRDDPYFHYWLRTFSGTAPNVTGYLVHLRLPCRELAATGPANETWQRCSAQGTSAVDTGLRAYRVVDGHAPEDVTGDIAPATLAAVRKISEAYQDQGAGDVFADTSRLAQVPVLRWTAEADPDRPLPATAAGVFDHGYQVHAGFVVWEGDRFVYRQTVTAAQWPCPAGKPSLCPEEDRYVATGK